MSPNRLNEASVEDLNDHLMPLMQTQLKESIPVKPHNISLRCSDHYLLEQTKK
jgi:hypothetical protein